MTQTPCCFHFAAASQAGHQSAALGPQGQHRPAGVARDPAGPRRAQSIQAAENTRLLVMCPAAETTLSICTLTL